MPALPVLGLARYTRRSRGGDHEIDVHGVVRELDCVVGVAVEHPCIEQRLHVVLHGCDVNAWPFSERLDGQ